MDKEKQLSRRSLLKIGGVSVLALSASKVLGGPSAKEMCVTTPKQPEGPFYPVADQPDKNNDLTMVAGRDSLALGTLLYLSGKVIDQHCQPVHEAVVEIWQACETGRYNHPGDRDNPSALDPNFQYWGIVLSDAQGAYNFKTIVPGHYEAGPGWIRPPHIHFKVHKRGFKELITQMYFAGNEYNADDRILRELPRSERNSVVRTLASRPDEAGRKAYDVSFDISLKKLI